MLKSGRSSHGVGREDSGPLRQKNIKEYCSFQKYAVIEAVIESVSVQNVGVAQSN
jgi:hypothetical protein